MKADIPVIGGGAVARALGVCRAGDVIAGNIGHTGADVIAARSVGA